MDFVQSFLLSQNVFAFSFSSSDFGNLELLPTALCFWRFTIDDEDVSRCVFLE